TNNTTGFSGSIGLISWSLTGSSAPNTNEGGPSSFGVLLGDNDGVGIGQDEITFGGEYLTLTFSEQVTLTAAYFLDLFIAPKIEDFEVANITIGSAPGAADAFANADDVFQNNFGYRELTGLGLFGSSFTFWAGGGNDNRGSADFALAAVDISPVPLPAGLVLLGTALAGFGALRRKRQNVA
ncbi:MAG: VPLPA-CTERM sorting domain-containing protein, partial [Paracoccaceae bacterium]